MATRNDRLVWDLPGDGPKGVFLKVLGITTVVYLLWVGISTALHTSEVEDLQDRIRVLETNVTQLAIALSRLQQNQDV